MTTLSSEGTTDGHEATRTTPHPGPLPLEGRGSFSSGALSQGGVRGAVLPWAKIFLPRWGGS